MDVFPRWTVFLKSPRLLNFAQGGCTFSLQLSSLSMTQMAQMDKSIFCLVFLYHLNDRDNHRVQLKAPCSNATSTLPLT